MSESPDGVKPIFLAFEPDEDDPTKTNLILTIQEPIWSGCGRAVSTFQDDDGVLAVQVGWNDCPGEHMDDGFIDPDHIELWDIESLIDAYHTWKQRQTSVG